MSEAMMLFNDVHQPKGQKPHLLEKPFSLKKDSEWKVMTSAGDYQSNLQEELRHALVRLLEGANANVRIDLKNITHIDVTYLNALMSFADVHKDIFPAGKLEIININKKALVLFNLVQLSELYNFQLSEG